MDSHIGGLGLAITIIASCLVKGKNIVTLTILLALHSLTAIYFTKNDRIKTDGDRIYTNKTHNL